MRGIYTALNYEGQVRSKNCTILTSTGLQVYAFCNIKFQNLNQNLYSIIRISTFLFTYYNFFYRKMFFIENFTYDVFLFQISDFFQVLLRFSGHIREIHNFQNTKELFECNNDNRNEICFSAIKFCHKIKSN